MMCFRLHVVLAMPAAAFAPPLSERAFPPEVEGDVSVGADVPALPADSATLVLTDDLALADKLAGTAPERLHVVYAGGAPVDEALFERLEDVWPAGESPELRGLRYDRLLRALKESFDLWFYKNTLLTTINDVPDMLWYKRLDGTHMLVNDAFAAIVEKPKDDIQGKDHFSIWDVPRPAKGAADFACAESEKLAISSGRMHVCDEPVKTRAGMKLFTTYKSPLYDRFGNVFGTVGVGHDVTSINSLGSQLYLLVENLPYPICIFTLDWKVVQMNSVFAELVGLDPDGEHSDFDYQAWKRETFTPVDEPTENHVKQIASHELMFNRGGIPRHYVVMDLEIRNHFGDVTGYLCTLEDVTYRRAYERSMLNAANTDKLTGLYNRRAYSKKIRELSEKLPERCCVVMADINGLKEANDTRGHNVGDELITGAAACMSQAFQDFGTVYRLGGDEFCVLMTGTAEDAAGCLKQLEKNCAAWKGQYIESISISCGVASAEEYSDIASLTKAADERMYESKRNYYRSTGHERRRRGRDKEE